MKWACAIFLLIYFSVGLRAQSHRIDSLKDLLPETAGEERIEILHALAYDLLFTTPEEALRYTEQSLALSIQSNAYNRIANTYHLFGIYYDIQGNYELSIENYKKGIAILMDHSVEAASVLLALNTGLGLAYARKGSYTEALACHFKALDLAKDTKSPYLPATLLNIGLIYHDQKEYHEALNYYFQCKERAEALNSTEWVAKAVTNIGIVYKESKRYNEAIRYLTLSLEKKTLLQNDLSLSATLSEIADTYKEMQQYNTALEYLDRAEVFKVKVNDTWGLVFVNNVRAQIHIAQRDFKQAESILKKNLARTGESGSTNRSSVYERFYDLYNAQGDYKQALAWHVKKTAYEDSLFNEKKSKQLAELQTLYDVANKEKEIALLEKKNEEERFVKKTILLIAGSLAMITLLLFYLFRLRIKKRQELNRVQLRLQQQEIENARLREEELQKEIEFKNKELASYTINFVQKSELMDELKQTIQSIKADDDQVNRQLTGLTRLVESSYQVDREWEDFRLQFENVHPGFFKNLKERCPELSSGDLKLCALLKLNMNMKEAARVLGISPESVKTARYRLRKKLGLRQEENLVDYILHSE